ncbi:OmpA family protein [Spirosoma montaniterrae]|nr:OmpA family protein [Spirosoma montaniterrae]
MNVVLLFLGCCALPGLCMARPAPCLRLAGVVQDYATRQPLVATLSLKTATGRVKLASSAEATGSFSVDVNCPATALVIERTGYRTQSLPLDGNGSTAGPVYVFIPLVSVDKQGSDRAYQQSEQTFYEQNQSATPSGRPQRGTFVVTDALTGTPLRAQTCLFSTNAKTKRCFDADAAGQFLTQFTQQDIVAMEVRMAGYQPYQGNLIVEKVDGRSLRHDIRLLRQLTLLAVQTNIANARCELRTAGGAKTIGLLPVPGGEGWFCAYDLLPQRYQLQITDASGRVVRQEAVTVRPGLNLHQFMPEKPPTTARPLPEPVVAVTNPPAPPNAPRRKLQLPDELPLLYFDQGSYLLDDDDKDVLRQVADYLRTHPGYRVKLVGHTDPKGDERLNRYLAEFRAKVIANFLHWQGVPDNRMDVTGQGSRYPVSPSDTDENKAKNRRVFLKLEVDP